MANYTVKDVEQVKELPDFSGGPAKVLKLTFESGESAELFAMQNVPDPEVGAKLEGTIESSGYGPKFKKAGGRGGGGGGKSPAQEKRIVRQHSQEQAIRVMAILGYVLPEEAFVNLVNWFEDDAFGKLKSGTNSWPMTSDVPADTDGLIP